jgi:hypothetical protein
MHGKSLSRKLIDSYLRKKTKDKRPHGFFSKYLQMRLEFIQAPVSSHKSGIPSMIRALQITATAGTTLRLLFAAPAIAFAAPDDSDPFDVAASVPDLVNNALSAANENALRAQEFERMTPWPQSQCRLISGSP